MKIIIINTDDVRFTNIFLSGSDPLQEMSVYCGVLQKFSFLAICVYTVILELV